MKNGICCFIIMLLVFIVSPIFAETNVKSAEQALLSQGQQLQSFINGAIENNPELKMLRKKQESYKTRVLLSLSLDEPELEIGFLNLPANNFSLRDMDETIKEFKLMQMIPFPGKLSLKSEIADKESKIVFEEYETKRNEIRANVKKVYYGIFLTKKSIEITKKTKKILEDVVRVASAKYSSGMGLQSDVLRAQVELSKMDNELIMLEQEEKILDAKLNAVLGGTTPKNIIEVETIEKTEFKMNLEQVKETTLNANPGLKINKLTIDRGNAMFDLSQKEFLPDFGLGVAYGQRDPMLDGTKRVDMLSFMLTVDLPFLWGTKGYEADIAKIEIEEAKAGYESKKNEVFFMLEMIYAEIEKNKRSIKLFETGVLPQVKQTVDTAKANYESNKIDFFSLLETQMLLYKYEIEYYRVLVDYEKNIAELESIVNMDVAGMGGDIYEKK